MNRFWRDLATEDAVNEEIWARSPDLQRRIQPPEALQLAGAVGAQQAMLPGDPHGVLPWVPDLFGRSWHEPDALLVVASAYAGFIAECSTRHRCLQIADYRPARTWTEFQRVFVARDVDDDPNYYGPIAQLVATVTGRTESSHLALFDLCRASFVRRGQGGNRSDVSDDRMVRNAADTYNRYVDAGDGWSWRNVSGGDAVRVVALGTIAEHGLLRLFAAHGCAVRHSRTGEVWKPIAARHSGAWVARYADSRYRLATWLQEGCWWEISSSDIGRVWRVLPLAHPSRSQHDPGYARASSVLQAISV